MLSGALVSTHGYWMWCAGIITWVFWALSSSPTPSFTKALPLLHMAQEGSLLEQRHSPRRKCQAPLTPSHFSNPRSLTPDSDALSKGIVTDERHNSEGDPGVFQTLN